MLSHVLPWHRIQLRVANQNKQYKQKVVYFVALVTIRRRKCSYQILTVRTKKEVDHEKHRYDAFIGYFGSDRCFLRNAIENEYK
ncbi:hypothetical protein A7311_04425 [Paenibacillus polymyxa]|nr:hypothetical protein A7311_04425 [Paenibacillus polymyxa]